MLSEFCNQYKGSQFINLHVHCGGGVGRGVGGVTHLRPNVPPYLNFHDAPLNDV